MVCKAGRCSWVRQAGTWGAAVRCSCHCFRRCCGCCTQLHGPHKSASHSAFYRTLSCRSKKPKPASEWDAVEATPAVNRWDATPGQVGRAVRALGDATLCLMQMGGWVPWLTGMFL